MASTFSPNLSIELIGTGDQAGTWGTTTNSNLGTLIEQAISGYVTQAVATGTDTTITIPNGATGVARNMYIELTGTGGASTNLIVPANKKLYFIFNNSSGAVTVKVSGQTGVSVPTGKKMVLVSNGTDIVNGLNYIADFGTNSFTVTNLTASSGTITNLIATSGSITNLVSSDASATVLRAGSATLTHLSATSASITNLSLTSLTISSLSITNVSVASATVSSNLTLSGGTANGVLYLNGSKVATSGSALVFDGTNLGIGGSGDPFGRFYGRSVGLTSASSAALEINSATGSTSAIDLGVNSSRTAGITSNTTETNFTTLGATPLLFGINSTEGMRLTPAGNLGIGTASPTNKLNVSGNGYLFALNGGLTNRVAQTFGNTGGGLDLGIEGSAGGTVFTGGSSYAGVIGTNNATVLQLGTNGTIRATLDTSGNLGIGTASPAAKFETFNSAVNAAFVPNTASTWRVAQIRNDGTGTAGSAAGIAFVGRTDVQPAGIAAIQSTTGGGNTSLSFMYVGSNITTEGMRLDTSGNLGLGVTPSAWDTTLSRALQLNGGSLWGYSTSQINVLQNAYYNASGNFVYTNTAAASAYRQISGAHSWLTAASGTAGNAISFTQAMTLDASGNLGIGTASPGERLDVRGGGLGVGNGTIKTVVSYTTEGLIGTTSNHALLLYANNAERARITSGGAFIVGKTAASFGGTEGFFVANGDSSDVGYAAQGYLTRVSQLNRQGDDGNLVEFFQDSNLEGTISVSGTTVSYNGGHLSRWSQTADNTRIFLLKGTVMSNLDQMAAWEKDGQPLPNEQLNCMKVSDVEGDVNVAGVFVNWDNDDDVYTNDMNIAMTGDMIIRIAQNVTVQRGDLLMSAGDGTAKPQGDDIIRSKTVAKVTSNHVTCTYEDGSYCVPCVLMAC